MALGTMTAISAYANPYTEEYTGIFRDTASASNWQAKYLGVSDDWAAQLTNYAIPYGGVYEVAPDYWNAPGLSWITPYSDTYGPDGYYSYVTTITDNFSHLGSDQSVALKELSIKYSSDDLFQAIVINGVHYGGFSPQEHGAFNDWVLDYISDIDYWNVGSPNTIEFIIRNNGGSDFNPTGFAAEIQATYLITTIPEPETYAMMLAGLGIVGAIARRRRNRSQ
ncbi:MAG: PEPxxWA-CTERM sorting domain-containing protein [Betaproteobacteria bacterium]|nr:PEPxxWA-CTERM sorting domain-containing protein [Betaproteobacteria bacterium]